MRRRCEKMIEQKRSKLARIEEVCRKWDVKEPPYDIPREPGAVFAMCKIGDILEDED